MIVFKRYVVPCYRTVCSESSKLNCSTYVLTGAENLVALLFQKFRNFPTVAMVLLREPANVRDTRRRFSALSASAVSTSIWRAALNFLHLCLQLHLVFLSRRRFRLDEKEIKQEDAAVFICKGYPDDCNLFRLCSYVGLSVDVICLIRGC